MLAINGTLRHVGVNVGLASLSMLRGAGTDAVGCTLCPPSTAIAIPPHLNKTSNAGSLGAIQTPRRAFSVTGLTTDVDPVGSFRK